MSLSPLSPPEMFKCIMQSVTIRVILRKHLIYIVISHLFFCLKLLLLGLLDSIIIIATLHQAPKVGPTQAQPTGPLPTALPLM